MIEMETIHNCFRIFASTNDKETRQFMVVKVRLLSMMSIAESLAKIADCMGSQDSRDSLAESAFIWGTGD